MSDINPIVRLPLDIQEEIEQLRLEKQNALMITKIIESKYATMLIDGGHKVPTFSDISKYVKWAKKNRGVPTKQSSISDIVADEFDDELAQELTTTSVVDNISSFEDNVLKSEIDLTTPKNTLDDVKKRLQLSIQRLEKKRISLGEEYNDKLESTLRGYYVELYKLTHAEVKMAEELRDSDKVDVATVTFILNKLFQCVAATIVEIDEQKRGLFFNLLREKVKQTKNDILEDVIKEMQ